MHVNVKSKGTSGAEHGQPKKMTHIERSNWFFWSNTGCDERLTGISMHNSGS
jgi:hypothetical protein